MYRGKEEQNRYLEHFPYVDILFWLFGGEIRRATYTCGPSKSTAICPVSSTAAAKATISHKHASARDLIGFCWIERQKAEKKLNF
jgi:hypothetical protein